MNKVWLAFIARVENEKMLKDTFVEYFVVNSLLQEKISA